MRKDSSSGKGRGSDRKSFGTSTRGKSTGGFKKSSDKPYDRDKKAGDDRPKRAFDKDGDRPKRSFNNDSADRPKRSFDKDSSDRPKRSFDKPFDKERKFDNDRPKRSFDKDSSDRPKRSFDRDSTDRPKKSFDKPYSKDKNFDNDRPKRSFDKDSSDRPKRSFDRDSTDRPKRSFDKDSSDRPKRSFDKPFDKDRKFDNDRPKRSFDKDGTGTPKRFDDKKGGKFKKDDRKESQKAFSERNVFKEDKAERPIEDYEKNFVTPQEFEKTLEDDSPKFSIKKKDEEQSFDKAYPLGARKVSGPFRKKFQEEQAEPEKARKPRRKKDEEAEDPIADKILTLNTYIAHSGESSRREAAEMVKQGKVKVNGELILEPGYRVQPGDLVTIAGKKLTPTKNMVYVLMNKPKGYITTTDDPEGRDTVMDLIDDLDVRVYPVGRLDRNTTGLLLLTNDGNLAQKLSHPSYEVKKVYHVTLDKPLTKKHYEAIMAGLTLEDGEVKVDDLAYLEEKNEMGIEIHSGRNRIVRRIFESLGYVVEKLDRMMYAGLTKKNLPRGKWRLLVEKEIILLKHFKS